MDIDELVINIRASLKEVECFRVYEITGHVKKMPLAHASLFGAIN